jgi:GNAT superfamily N-acetyltransferase
VDEEVALNIHEVDGIEYASLLNYMNAHAACFPRLESKHLAGGVWWLAVDAEPNVAVGFAGLVEMAPFEGVGYLKRGYVIEEYRGQGLQLQFMQLREAKARELKWHMLVGECCEANTVSAQNFIKAGYKKCAPEQPWGELGSIYFKKRL